MSEQKQAASYQLVPMTIELIPQIAELERLCFSKPWNEQMLAEELDNPTASFIVAVGDNGQVLGYAGISVIAGEGYIDTAVKILIAVVLGALLLAGLYALFGDVVMPTLNERITNMFNYAGALE